MTVTCFEKGDPHLKGRLSLITMLLFKEYKLNIFFWVAPKIAILRGLQLFHADLPSLYSSVALHCVPSHVRFLKITRILYLISGLLIQKLWTKVIFFFNVCDVVSQVTVFPAVSHELLICLCYWFWESLKLFLKKENPPRYYGEPIYAGGMCDILSEVLLGSPAY